MHRLEKTSKLNIRQDRYDKKEYNKKRKKPREKLAIGEKVNVLTERIKKKSAPAKFYKQSVQNISYFNKETIFTIHKKKVIDNIMYYSIKTSLAKLSKRFSRSELFALKGNFM